MIFMILSGIVALVSICAVIFISMQTPKESGLGAVTGTYTPYQSSKSRKKTRDEKLLKITAILVAAFFVIVILLNFGFIRG